VFLTTAAVGIVIALLAKYFQLQELSNYVWFIVSATFGVTIVAAGRGLHHDFLAFDDDRIALQRPWMRIFLGSGVALVIALALSTGAASLKLGDMSTRDVPNNIYVAMALGSLLGIANVEAFRLIVRYASQAIRKVSAASARH
jgi:hypothetical protein